MLDFDTNCAPGDSLPLKRGGMGGGIATPLPTAARSSSPLSGGGEERVRLVVCNIA
jgi:hypothetical protein